MQTTYSADNVDKVIKILFLLIESVPALSKEQVMRIKTIMNTEILYQMSVYSG